MLKKIAYSLLFVSFGAFGAAGSSVVILNGASPLEILHAGRVCLEKPQWMGDESRRSCLGACEKAIDEEIKQERYDQLLPVASFLMKTLVGGCSTSNNIIEKCMLNYPDFISDDNGRMLFADVLRRKLNCRDIAKLEAMCARISPENFTEALQVVGQIWVFRSSLWNVLTDSAFVEGMKLSKDQNVGQLVVLIDDMEMRISRWWSYAKVGAGMAFYFGLDAVYARIIHAFEQSIGCLGLSDCEELLQVYQIGIENKEIWKYDQTTIIKALTVLKKMGMHPSSLFVSDRPEGESLFSAGLTYTSDWSDEGFLKICSLLSPEEFDVEAERLQRLDSFRYWYAKHQEALSAWAKKESNDATKIYLERLNRAGHNALQQHQTLFQLLAPMLKEMHA